MKESKHHKFTLCDGVYFASRAEGPTNCPHYSSYEFCKIPLEWKAPIH